MLMCRQWQVWLQQQLSYVNSLFGVLCGTLIKPRQQITLQPLCLTSSNYYLTNASVLKSSFKLLTNVSSRGWQKRLPTPSLLRHHAYSGQADTKQAFTCEYPAINTLTWSAPPWEKKTQDWERLEERTIILLSPLKALCRNLSPSRKPEQNWSWQLP